MIKLSKLFFVSFLILTLALSIIPYFPLPSVKADTEDSGFNMLTSALDISIGVTGSYQEIDVSAYIPEGSTGVILEFNNVGAGYGGFSARKEGSTDDYYHQDSLQPRGHIYMMIGVDENRVFEIKIRNTDCDTYLLGWTDENVYFYTNAIDYNLGVTLSWEDIDLSSDVPEGSTGAIMQVFAVANQIGGIRHPDSSDTHSFVQMGTQTLYCGINSSRMIQGYINHISYDHYLIGYTSSPIVFNVDWDDVSIVPTGAWTNIDVTVETEEDANGIIIFIDCSGGVYKGTIREDGSGDDRSADSENVNNGGTVGLCPLLVGEVLEGYIENVNVDFFVVGYTLPVEGELFVYPDHVEDSYEVTNATHSLEYNGTYAQVNATGWIIWDFAESIANVTKINWAIVCATDSYMWRIEGSNDAVEWTILVQTERSHGSVPSPTLYNSRYDSEMHTRYRYLRLTEVKGTMTEWFVDCVFFSISPPVIVYSDSWVYPTVMEYWNWEIFSGHPIMTHYASRPYTILGKNASATTEASLIWNSSTQLVNADFDSDNRAVVKFSDYYNITSAYVHAMQSRSDGHFYLYMSTTGDSDDWELVGDWSGIQSMNYYGSAIVGVRIRYLMVNCTGSSSNPIWIESFRIAGVVHTGEGGNGGTEGYEWSFNLLPNWFADALGIPLMAGQLFASGIILACFLLPFAFYERRSFWATLIVGLVVLAFLVVVGWLPSWIMLLIALLVAGLFGQKFSNWYGGR